MTLFFVDRGTARVMGRRALVDDAYKLLDDAYKLVSVSDVVAIVDKKDQWVTTKDRHDAKGQIVHPQRQAELLTRYYVVIRSSI